MYRFLSRSSVLLFLVVVGLPAPAESASCPFTFKDKDVHPLAEKAFLDWDPDKKLESFTLQPRFEGNSADFSVLIVTPAQPTVEPASRALFTALDTLTILNQRRYPISKLKDPPRDEEDVKRSVGLRVLPEEQIGVVKHQTFGPERLEDLFTWLKQHQFDFTGAEDVLKAYAEKRWFFTILMLDPAQVPKKGDAFRGELQPMRFTFTSDRLVYPLRINQPRTREPVELTLYVQAPYKVDLPGELSYQYQWVPMLLNSRGWFPRGAFGSDDLPGKADDWLKAIDKDVPALLKKGQDLGWSFVNRTRPQPNKLGRSATALEWAHRITSGDVKIMRGDAPFGETVPDPDEGFVVADLKDGRRKEAIFKVIAQRQAKCYKDHPFGYLVRAAPASALATLKTLTPVVQEGKYLTRLRKVFSRDEMNDDLILQRSKWGLAEDDSEYTELLPASPP
ncbi:MAG: DUF2330 domain-containing protein [Gemmataceae bacterium]|nr:DUF2330 domain-containing protein [Gemmataceae bacterium]